MSQALVRVQQEAPGDAVAAASAPRLTEVAAAPGYRHVIEAILFCTYAAFGVSWIALTPLLGDLQKELHASSAAAGLLNTAVSAAKVIAPLATGLVAVRLGLRRTLLGGSALIALAAVATPLAPNFPSLLIARFTFGLGGAVVVTLLGPAVMQWYERSELPLVNALNNVAVNTGITLTLFLTVPLASRLGWRHTLLVYAAANAALCVAWAVFGRERATSPSSAGSSGAAGGARFIDVWRLRETWLIAAAFTAPLALYLAFNTWLPRYYVEALGMDRAAASRYAGLFNLVGIPSAIAGGVLTRSLGLRRPFLIFAGVVIGFAAFGMLLLHSPAALMVSAALLGMSFFIAGSPLFTTVMELPGITPAHVSLIMGTVFSSAYLVSSVSPLLVGWLRDRTGSFVPGLSLWAALSWVLLPCGLLLPETGPSRRGATPPNGA